MVHLILAVAFASANVYTGVTTVISGVSTVAGKAMTGGAQLYQPQNILYFRTATVQLSATDEISLKMAGATLAPVAAAQAKVLADHDQVLADLDKMSAAKDDYKAALKKMSADIANQDMQKAELDGEAAEKAEKHYDELVKKVQEDRVKMHHQEADVVGASNNAITQLSTMLDGLVSSGKAKSF